MYTPQAYQSSDGLILTIEYTVGSIENTGNHNFSFGLVSDEVDLAAYTGTNPFKDQESVFSIGVNLTANGDANFQGMNFSNGSQVQNLDQ